ncbi:hypothetical protein N5W20_05510 [Candidatus Kirkpatrickella diaphorinae]|uniref:DNA-directed RNA polymerase n=1 Tax=Candidatus Kirkpatrickella diaphorinae TaxID=2984322 RepID=A0ABY6GHR2_9PROT|nr:hypothetical protein [Candidatus Kirkpatrickella diaphorinae]UYH50586.1 hypothetical protein N5W20_05510 [Candidatus Kirkpatrickella diaphorinae]
MRGRSGTRPKLHAAPLASFADDVEKLAVIAAATVVGEVGRALTPRATHVALEIARALKAQLDMNTFLRSAKGRKKEDATAAKALVKAFRAAHPKPTPRQWASWKKRLEQIEFAQWTEQQRLAIGALLLDRVCAASEGGIVCRDLQTDGAKNPAKHVMASAELLQALSEDNDRLSVGAPRKMPMIIPPMPWRYVTLSEGVAP